MLPSSMLTYTTYFSLTLSNNPEEYPVIWDQIIKNNTVTFSVSWKDTNVMEELKKLSQLEPECTFIFSDSGGNYIIYEKRSSDWNLVKDWDSDVSEVSIENWD